MMRSISESCGTSFVPFLGGQPTSVSSPHRPYADMFSPRQRGYCIKNGSSGAAPADATAAGAAPEF